ncbi:MBL fold metallo-hydrolase [Methylibium sp.]|uniref:MBL fold metallo-hydrolase n=1 Tax=Methylibium sp. TaxID=2067992 RepID=UPI003D0C94DE
MALFIRTLLVLLGVAALALASACGTAGTVLGADGPAAAPRAIEVAAGVYMVRGASGEIDAANRGRVGNAGFIVGDGGVIAIDSGTSYRHGQALLAEIARVTDKPVRLLLLTHARQEFLFGALAFRERGIPIHMQRQASRLMTARCEGCLKTLNRLLGEEAMRGTAMFKPDVEFDTTHELNLTGRPVRVLYYGHSSGPGDIAVLDVRTGVLFAGGLLDQHRIPDVQDSELGGWRQALQALRGLPLRQIVPGHGAAGPAGLIDGVDRYLTQLETRLLELTGADAALSEVPDAAALPEFKDWDQYQTVHRRNASILFVRMEREQLVK